MGPSAREFGFIVFVRAVSVAVGYIRFAAFTGWERWEPMLP